MFYSCVKDSLSGVRQFLKQWNNWKLLKNNEKGFLFHFKSFFRSWNIYIFVLTFGYSEKQLDKNVNSRTYDVTGSTKINCNTHIVQYLKNSMQSGNEIWWGNRK